MRFIVVGAGAVGGVVGGRLAQHGHDVVLVARGRHLEAIQTDGLRIESAEDVVNVRVPAVATPADIDWTDGDVVLLAVKSQHTEAALEALRAAVPQRCAVSIACLQNGVDNERRALRLFPLVHGVYVRLPSYHLQPGAVTALSTPISGVLNVGAYPSGVDKTAHGISTALSRSTFLSSPSHDIMSQKYAKLLINLGTSVGALCDDKRYAASVSRRAREEGRSVLRAAGIAVATSDFDAALVSQLAVRTVDGQSAGGGSTWQSLERGTASVETDYLNGEIVLLGRLHGVATPVNETLQRLTTCAGRTHRAPGFMSTAELSAALDG